MPLTFARCDLRLAQTTPKNHTSQEFPTQTQIAASRALSAATSGALGGWLSLTVTADDGTLPTTPGVCESVAVDVVLTASPGEVFTIATSGDLCTHFLDGTSTLSASFGAKQVSYSGSHRRARLVGDGLIGFKRDFTGALAAVSATLRW